MGVMRCSGFGGLVQQLRREMGARRNGRWFTLQCKDIGDDDLCFGIGVATKQRRFADAFRYE